MKGGKGNRVVCGSESRRSREVRLSKRGELEERAVSGRGECGGEKVRENIRNERRIGRGTEGKRNTGVLVDAKGGSREVK